MIQATHYQHFASPIYTQNSMSANLQSYNEQVDTARKMSMSECIAKANQTEGIIQIYSKKAEMAFEAKGTSINTYA